MVVSFIGRGNRSTHRKPLTCANHLQTSSHNVVASKPYLGRFKLTTLVMMPTDCIGSYTSNYHTIITAPIFNHIYFFLLERKKTLGLHFFLCGDMIYWF
jgi:hypothetical protein